MALEPFEEQKPIAPFGWEVHLAGPALDEPRKDALRALYREHGLLLVRGLRLSHAEQIEFCRIFGPVHDSASENFIVSNVASDGLLGTRELLWHNDVPYLPEPYLAGCLHALDVAPDAAGTRFASGYRALERLPAGLRQRISGMKALHVRERVFDRTNRLTDLIEGDMCTVHDLVRRDAEGREYLFINQAWTALIIGLSQEVSDSLQAELCHHFYAPDNCLEHRWQAGDLLLWDNLAVQHARSETGSGARTLQRVTIAELGYEAQYPSDLRAIYRELHNETMLADPA